MTPLTMLSRKLSERTGKPAPGYNRCRRAILDNQIPAQKVGREWFVDDADLATAEGVLGLASLPCRAAPVAA